MPMINSHTTALAGARRRRRRRVVLSDRAFGIVLVSPAVLLLLLVVVYPVLQAVKLSVQSVVLLQPGHTPYVGLDNYRQLIFEEPSFWQVWRNTAVFVTAITVGSFAAGFTLALLLRNVKRARGALRTLFLLPYVMPTIVLSLLWLWMFNSTFGIVNYLLDAVGLIDGFRPWFSSARWAFLPVVVLFVWKGAAFQMIMITAGLSRVPHSLYDAASVDGATAVRRFWHVTLPSMRPVLITLVLLSVMFGMQQFTPLWLLTQGGPGYSTTTTAIWVYRLAFQRFDFGLAAALGTVWMAVLVVLTIVVLRVNRPSDR